MFSALLLTEHELRLIKEVAESKMVASEEVEPKFRIGNHITADYWKGIAKRIEKLLQEQAR